MAAIGTPSFGCGYPAVAVAEPRVAEQNRVDLLSALQQLERDDIRMAIAEDGNMLLYNVRNKLDLFTVYEESESESDDSYSSDSNEDIDQCGSIEGFSRYYRHEDKKQRIAESIAKSCKLQLQDFKDVISEIVEDVALRYGYDRHVVYEQVIYIVLEDQERKIRRGGLENNREAYIENLTFFSQMAGEKNCDQLVQDMIRLLCSSKLGGLQ